MGRLSLRILLLLVLLQYHVVMGEKIKVPACPAKKVCTVFTDDSCMVNGVLSTGDKPAGYIWKDETSCQYAYYYYQHVRLDIEPVSVHNWSFVMIFRGDVPLTTMGFVFGNARIAFPNTSTVQLAWRKTADAEWQTSNSTLKWDGNFNSKHLYVNYSFSIDSPSEKLFNLFGVPEFNYTREGKDIIVFKDEEILGLLNHILPCNTTDLKEVCHSGCDEMEISPFGANCSSNLWFHPTAYAKLTREWHAADDIECVRGNWEATWQGGSQVLDAAGFEVQCAPETPAKWTSLFVGACAGGGVLLLIVIVVCCCCAWKCTRKRHNQSETNKGTTRSSKSDARTTSSKKKHFWSKGPSTNIEGLQTEKFSAKDSKAKTDVAINLPPSYTDRASAEPPGRGSAEPPPPPYELLEPAVNEAAAGPPLPKGFASVAVQ